MDDIKPIRLIGAEGIAYIQRVILKESAYMREIANTLPNAGWDLEAYAIQSTLPFASLAGSSGHNFYWSTLAISSCGKLFRLPPAKARSSMNSSSGYFSLTMV